MLIRTKFVRDDGYEEEGLVDSEHVEAIIQFKDGKYQIEAGDGFKADEKPVFDESDFIFCTGLNKDGSTSPNIFVAKKKIKAVGVSREDGKLTGCYIFYGASNAFRCDEESYNRAKDLLSWRYISFVEPPTEKTDPC